MLITDEYRKMNQTLHADKATYGASGKRWVPQVLDLVNFYNTKDILDYGCGKGTLRTALPYKIKEYDPAIEGKDKPPDPAEIVVCVDVLEHIEPDHLDEVLDHLQQLTRLAGFFVAATRPAKKHLPDGRNAHLIIEDANWWLSKLSDRFRVVRWETDSTQKGEALFWVEPRSK